jgi:AsmA protein
MSTRKKVILGILIFLVVFLVALVVIVPLLLDVDRYRPQVASLIEEQTGKPAEIGHLALTVFPSLSIRVDDFGLKNPSGFPQGYFVKAQRIYAVVDVGGLWNRQVIIKSLDLETPAISLLSDVKGSWNFQNKPSSAEAAPDPPGQKPLFTLGAISNVKIIKGKLSVANLLPSGDSGPVFFEADGVSSQLRQIDFNALTESASVHPDAVSPEPGAVSEARWLTSVAYATDQNGKLVAEGTLKMDSVHVMNLVVTNVKSKLRLFPKQVFLDDLDYKCYDGHAVENLSFSLAGQNPHYNTDAKLEGVNVAKLLDAFPNARGKMTGTLEITVKLDGEVSHSPDPLAGMGGSGQMTIRNGKLPTLQLNKDLLELARVAKMGPASGDLGSFSSIAMDFTIANNRINTTKATIVGNGVDVDASGSLALAGEGSLDYQGVAKVAASQNALTSILGGLSGATVAGGKMAFPFNLKGTLQNPKFTLKSGGTGSQLGAVTGALGGQKAAARQQQQPANAAQGITGLVKKKP